MGLQDTTWQQNLYCFLLPTFTVKNMLFLLTSMASFFSQTKAFLLNLRIPLLIVCVPVWIEQQLEGTLMLTTSADDAAPSAIT